jgi:hypothetical protein
MDCWASALWTGVPAFPPLRGPFGTFKDLLSGRSLGRMSARPLTAQLTTPCLLAATAPTTRQFVGIRVYLHASRDIETTSVSFDNGFHGSLPPSPSGRTQKKTSMFEPPQRVMGICTRTRYHQKCHLLAAFDALSIAYVDGALCTISPLYAFGNLSGRVLPFEFVQNADSVSCAAVCTTSACSSAPHGAR